MDKLIVSLDLENFTQACELIDLLSPKVQHFKVGIAPFTAFGDALLGKLADLNKKVFLDLKFHDIPNTVYNAARAAAHKGVYMMNFHCLGGGEMLQAAVAGVDAAKPQQRPSLLGVTILTSMSEANMHDLGLVGTVEKKVLELAQLAKDSGMDGVVASAKEAKLIRENLGDDFLIVTPGIRPSWALKQNEDQKRVLTPAQAIEQGSNYIVVGRPIIAASDPLEAAQKIITELEE